MVPIGCLGSLGGSAASYAKLPYDAVAMVGMGTPEASMRIQEQEIRKIQRNLAKL